MAKKLLNESTIRRFQRLANMKPINEMYHKRDDEMMEAEEEEMDMDMEAGEEEAPMDDMEMDAEEPAEMDGDLELTDEEAQAIIDLGEKLKAAMGDEEDMGDMDMEAGEEEAEMGDEEEIMEALRGINYQPSKSEVVNEVAKRVARRLAEAQKAEKRMNEALGRSTKRR